MVAILRNEKWNSYSLGIYFEIPLPSLPIQPRSSPSGTAPTLRGDAWLKVDVPVNNAGVVTKTVEKNADDPALEGEISSHKTAILI